MRLRTMPLSAFLLVALCASGRASTLANFIIVSAANPQVQHGTFDNGDTYSGTFTIDTSLIPATGAFSIPIAAFDVITYVPGGYNEAAPAFLDFATLTGTPVQIGGRTYSYDVLTIDYSLNEFDFVEPLGVFHGGAILYAFEADATVGFADTKGTALLVDPAIVDTPEPGTMIPMSAGVTLLAWMGRRRRARGALQSRTHAVAAL